MRQGRRCYCGPEPAVPRRRRERSLTPGHRFVRHGWRPVRCRRTPAGVLRTRPHGSHGRPEVVGIRALRPPFRGRTRGRRTIQVRARRGALRCRGVPLPRQGRDRRGRLPHGRWQAFAHLSVPERRHQRASATDSAGVRAMNRCWTTAAVFLLAGSFLRSAIAQTPTCPILAADTSVRRVQQSPAFSRALLLTQRRYMGTGTLTPRWIESICSGMRASVPRNVAGLVFVRAEMAVDLVALRATFAVWGDSVALLNEVNGDSALGHTIDSALWNRRVPPAMPKSPPATDMGAALEYACLFEELGANRASMDLALGQCRSTSYSVSRLANRGVLVRTDASEIELTPLWEVRVRRRP